jgi:hypothetical protein
MTPGQAVAFVRKHGVVLMSARGPVPSLAEAIVGETIRGSWWAHPRSHEIAHLSWAVYDAEDILVCRLVDGKVTLVHRRLWPALVRLAGQLPRARLAAVREEHTPQGKHRVVETAYPGWVPEDVAKSASGLSDTKAIAMLGEGLHAHLAGKNSRGTRGRARARAPRALRSRGA